jgi:hypothetical protein
MPDEKYRVGQKAPQGLYLRSEPVVKTTTKIAVLPMGHRVTKISESEVVPWWKVSTKLDDAEADGFVSSTFLVSDESFAPPQPANKISGVHLNTNSAVVRNNKARMAFPLNEASQPTRDKSDPANEKAKSLTAIIRWLDVEAKGRYLPTSQNTYCNIYAYDYCYLAGVYLPRVWWHAGALAKLRNGTGVSPIYGETVGELNANSLFNWLREYGPIFGWKRTLDLGGAQDAANGGRVVMICAKNKKPNLSGHICPIVPETGTAKADRVASKVTRPLQSQAGRVNRKYQTHQWWTNGTFQDWGWWINEDL